MGAPAGHRQLEHTADLALELWGASEVEVLRQGLLAVIEILTEGATVQPRERRVVTVDALDPADRLVRWLNEILFHAAVHGFVAADAEIELHDAGLRATLAGEADSPRIRTEIKSATYHDLALEHRDGRWVARVVLDI